MTQRMPGAGLMRCPVMANDGNTDCWDSRPGDLPVRSFCRRDPTSATPNDYDPVFGETRARGIQNSPPNGYSRFQHRTRVTRSGSDVRFFNPAIYAGPLGEDDEQPATIIEANCGDSSTLAGRVSALNLGGASHAPDHAGDQRNFSNTYGYQGVISPPTLSTISSRAESKSSVKIRSCTIGKTADEESRDLANQPEVHRYAVNGHSVVEFSASSVSGSNLSDRPGSTYGKRNAYEEWVDRKKADELRRKEEAARLEREKQAEEERLARERDERQEREKRNFLEWAKRKRREEASKREAVERELEIERRLKEIEDQAMMAKTMHLRQWARKKEEQQKALQKSQELRQKQEEEERKKRLAESSKAYEKWRETSKNRPRPATQGLLPHQKATPSYINPNPWVVDDIESTETPKPPSSAGAKRSGIRQTRSSLRRNIPYRQ